MIKTTQGVGAEGAAAQENPARQSWGTHPRIPCVRFEMPEERRAVVFSYAHFERLEWHAHAEGEGLEIHFSSHTVNLGGVNLRDLLTAFQRMEVEWVKAIPRRFALMGDGTAMVFSIVVEERGEDSEQGRGGGK